MNSIQFAARQAGLYFFIQNSRTAGRILRRIIIWSFLLITGLIEAIHYTHVAQ